MASGRTLGRAGIFYPFAFGHGLINRKLIGYVVPMVWNPICELREPLRLRHPVPPVSLKPGV